MGTSVSAIEKFGKTLIVTSLTLEGDALSADHGSDSGEDARITFALEELRKALEVVTQKKGGRFKINLEGGGRAKIELSAPPKEVKISDIKNRAAELAVPISQIIAGNFGPEMEDRRMEQEGYVVHATTDPMLLEERIKNHSVIFLGAFANDPETGKEVLIGFMQVRAIPNGHTEMSLKKLLKGIREAENPEILERMTQNPSEVAHMQLIMVDRNFRGGGISKMMTAECYRQLAALGFKYGIGEVPYYPKLNRRSYDFHLDGNHLKTLGLTIEAGRRRTPEGGEVDQRFLFCVGYIDNFAEQSRIMEERIRK